MSITTLEPAYSSVTEPVWSVTPAPNQEQHEVTVSSGETVYRNDFSPKSRKPEGVWRDEEYVF